MYTHNIFISSLLLLLSSDIYAGDYYCPRTNLFLEHVTNDKDVKGLYSTGMEGIGEPFPNKQSDVGKEPNYGRLNFETKNCSTKEFECLEFTQNRNLFTSEKTFYLFMPKVVELGKEYTFNNMRLVTNISHTIDSRDDARKSPIIQATLWQKIGEINV